MTQPTNLFDRCDGIRGLARICGVSPSTVQGWKDSERIPAAKQPLVLDRVAAAGIPITLEDVIWPLGKPEAAAA